MTVTRLLDITIVGLWSLVIFGVFILVSWQFQANWINKADGFFKDRYLVQPAERYEKIMSDYEPTGDNEIVIRELERMLHDLEALQKGDEIHYVKRTVYQQLVLTLLRKQQISDALMWTQRWLTFDSMDLDALLTHSLLLMIDPETKPQAEYQLARLRAQFPFSLRVASGSASAYASIGQVGSAFTFFVPFIKSNDNPLLDQIGDTFIQPWVLKTTPVEKVWAINKTGVEISYESGEEIGSLIIIFSRGMELAITITETRSKLELPFVTMGLSKTDDGLYRKRAGTNSSISLLGYQVRQPITIHIKTTVAKPETLETLLLPLMFPIVVEQLEKEGLDEPLQIYRRLYDASR
jgi:hypothetical protein